MDVETLKKYAIFVPLGVLVGLFVLGASNQSSLILIFAAVAGLIGLQTLFMPKGLSLSQGGPKTPVAQIGGVGIGLISVLMGIGGGVLNNMFMTLQGTPLKRAIATSAAVGVLIAVPGAVGAIYVGWGAAGLPPLSLGYVNILVMLVAIQFQLYGPDWCAPHALTANPNRQDRFWYFPIGHCSACSAEGHGARFATVLRLGLSRGTAC